MKNNSIVLFSGGTGGHVIPAVNFGNYLIDQGYNCSLFLDKRGTHYSKKFKGRIIKISSSHLSGNIFFIIKSFFLLLYGFIQSIFYLILLKPSHCVAFGSYATFMPLIAATILKAFRITTIHLHEQNSIVGKVNLFFLTFSKNFFLNFDNIKNLDFHHSKKILQVGLPYDDRIIYKQRSVKHKSETQIKIFVYGGSQGSINLNYGFIKMIKKLPNNFLKKLYIVIQSTNNQIPKIKTELKNLGINYEIKNFFNDILTVLDSSDMVFSRAGAGTINDIIKSQIPAILVPLPKAIYNHQYLNAKYLFDKDAAILIEEKYLNFDTTYLQFKELIENFDKRISLIKNLQSIKILDSNKLMLKKIFE